MITYRLSSKNHGRIKVLSHWMQIAPDLLLTKILEMSLSDMETIKDECDLTQDTKRKYELAELYKLLEPVPIPIPQKNIKSSKLKLDTEGTLAR